MLNKLFSCLHRGEWNLSIPVVNDLIPQQPPEPFLSLQYVSPEKEQKKLIPI